MRHDIADDKFRRQRQTPAVIDIIQRGTACPAGFCILYADVMHGFADFIRNGCRTGGKLFQRQLFNKVLDAAVQKFNPAGNIKNFVFFIQTGTAAHGTVFNRIFPAEKADDIVVFEKLQLRDFAQVIAYPVLMAFHKRHRLFARTVLRNRQNGHTVFFINAERQTARPSRMNDFHIKTQIGIDVKGLSTQQCNFHSRLPQIRLLVFFPEEKRRLHARMQHARL